MTQNSRGHSATRAAASSILWPSMATTERDYYLGNVTGATEAQQREVADKEANV